MSATGIGRRWVLRFWPPVGRHGAEKPGSILQNHLGSVTPLGALCSATTFRVQTFPSANSYCFSKRSLRSCRSPSGLSIALSTSASAINHCSFSSRCLRQRRRLRLRGCGVGTSWEISWPNLAVREALIRAGSVVGVHATGPRYCNDLKAGQRKSRPSLPYGGVDRGVAQLGSAGALGALGRRFESCRPDLNCPTPLGSS